MSFEFKRKETVPRALKRIMLEEIDQILTALAGGRRISRDNAIHDARKRIKKLRAVLRLAGDAVDSKILHQEDTVFRNVGRALSDARDAKILLDTFDQLHESKDCDASTASIQAVRAKLVARRQAALKQQKQHGTDEVVHILQAAKRRVRKCTIHGKGFSALRGGLKKVYRRGREAFANARYDRDAITLHDWRKRVKDLQLHTELIKPIWPDVLERFSSKAHELADGLGEDHDLFVLRQFLLQESAAFPTPMDLETLLEAIDDRRRKLQQAAMTLGDRLYSEKPADFIERMENYWNAWSAGEVLETG